MRQHALVLGLLLLAGGMQADFEWEYVGPSQWSAKPEPGDENCHAVVLFDKFYKDDRNGVKIRNYRRVMILDEKGYDAANVSITYPATLAGTFKVKGRTILPGGKVFWVEDKDIHSKILIKAGDVKVMETTFIFAQVAPGCIVEYQHEYHGAGLEPYAIWIFQEEIPVRRSEFHWFTNRVLPNYYFIDRLPKEKLTIHREPPDAKIPTELTFTGLQLPPVKNEGYSHPESERTATGYFYYALKNQEADAFWSEWAKDEHERLVEFGKKAKRLPQLLEGVPPAADGEEKLRAGYAALQRTVQNTGFLTQAQRAEDRFEELETVETFDQMMKYGYASGRNINRAFVTLARSLGYDAALAGVLDRTEHYFKKALQQEGQIDAYIVAMKGADGTYRFFDPGKPFLPFGRLEYHFQAVQGMKITAGGIEKVEISADAMRQNTVRHTLRIALRDDLTAEGRYAGTFQGQTAFAFWKRWYDASEEDRKTQLEEWLGDRLPERVRIGAYTVTLPPPGVETVRLEAEFELSGLGVQAGNRLLLSPAILRAAEHNPFTQDKRETTIIFDYNQVQTDEVEILLPPGWELEGLPADIHWKNALGGYDATFRHQDGGVRYERNWTRSTNAVKANFYGIVKEFYLKTQEFDQTVVALKAKP